MGARFPYLERMFRYEHGFAVKCFDDVFDFFHVGRIVLEHGARHSGNVYPYLRFRVKDVVIIIRTWQKLAPVNDASTQWTVVVILHVTSETFAAKDVITRRDDGGLGRFVADATRFVELVFDALVGDFTPLHGRPALWASVRGIVDLRYVCGL